MKLETPTKSCVINFHIKHLNIKLKIIEYVEKIYYDVTYGELCLITVDTLQYIRSICYFNKIYSLHIPQLDTFRQIGLVK